MADLAAHKTYAAEYSGLLSSLWITLGVGGACILGFEILSRIPRRRGREGPRFKHGTRSWLQDLFRTSGHWKKRRKRQSYRGLWSRLSMETEAHELQTRNRSDVKAVPLIVISGGENDDSAEARARKVQERLGSQEAWEFGYMYQPRAWNAVQPAEPLPKWPLLWMWKVISFPESKMPDRVGLDCTSHTRFLRGCLFYVVLHMCTTMVVLLPLHLEYAPDTEAKSSMLRAGLTISGSTGERKWLWVHVILAYWLSTTWVLTLIWIVWGVLMYRKRQIAEQRLQLHKTAATCKAKSRPNSRREKSEASVLRQSVTREELSMPTQAVNLTRSDLVDSTLASTSASTSNPSDNNQPTEGLGLDAPGYKRFRTILVTNIPPLMRNETTLAEYFTEHLSKNKASNEWKEIVPDFVKRQLDRTQEFVTTPRGSFQEERDPGSRAGSILNGETGATQGRTGSIMNGAPGIAQGLGLRTLAFFGEFDNSIVEDVILVRKLGELGALRQRRDDVVARLETAHVRLVKRILKDMMKHHLSILERDEDQVDTEKRDPEQILRMADRLKLYKTIRPFLPSEECESAADGSRETSPFATIWEALFSLPPEILDPYQPLTRKIGTSKTVNAPLIDFLASKLKIITEAMEALKEKPITDFTVSSSAFVTFKSAKLARRALKELSTHPLYAMGCRTQAAPDYSDLIWPRLNRSVFRADQVRGWVIAIVLFLITLLWIFPVSAICGLASITTISNLIPVLANYLDRHSTAASFVENVVPILLVAGLTIAVCPLLLLVANKAETLICGYQVHNSVMWRNWLFLEINVVIFFTVGKGVIQGYIFSKLPSAQNVLSDVASAFPAAAPYYASYLLLQTVIQSFFELFRLGLPILFYIFSTSRAITPRKRAQRLAHSTISWFFSIPNSLLAMGIVNLFTIYNSLVLPFAFVYYAFSFINYKRSMLWVYGRRYENNGRRNCVRYIRYSLDCLMVTQFSLLAFMILVKKKELAALSGVMLPLTVLAKLAGTRLVKFRFDRLRQMEADQIDEVREGKARTVSHVVKAPEKLWFRLIAGPWRFLDRYFTLPPLTHVSVPQLFVQWHQPILPPTTTLEIPDAVVGHPYSSEWDDIPSRDRMQSYRHQPWYYDAVQKFLWLPRDPLSTLDLEDTVEASLCLVTSQADQGLRHVKPIPSTPSETDEKISVKQPPQPMPRLTSGQSQIGTAVEDEDDLEDDPQTNLIGRTSRRVVRLLSHRRPQREDPSSALPKRRFTRINSHRYRSASVRRHSVNIVSNEATMAAAAKEEFAELEKLRAHEQKEREAEIRAQDMDATHPIAWYKAPFRSQS